MLVATGLALFVGFAVGPPSTDVIVFGVLSLVALVFVFFGVWALRLWRVGKVSPDKTDLIEPRFQPPIRLSMTLWLGMAGASMILFIAGLISLPTGIATRAVVSAFCYLGAASVVNRSIGGTLVNLAILRSASRNG